MRETILLAKKGYREGPAIQPVMFYIRVGVGSVPSRSAYPDTKDEGRKFVKLFLPDTPPWTRIPPAPRGVHTMFAPPPGGGGAGGTFVQRTFCINPLHSSFPFFSSICRGWEGRRIQRAIQTLRDS